MSIDTEVDAIRATAARHAEATNQPGRAGAEGYASIATADAYWMPPDAPAFTGREAIADFAQAFTDMPGFQMTWEHPEITVSSGGDIAYSVGTYSGTAEDPDGNRLEFVGKLVNVWHRQADGTWKVAVAIWNTNEPAAATS